jgi:hypothetical protein
MMEGAGLLLMTLAFALMLVPPLHITIAAPRIGVVHAAAELPESYRLAPPRADMDALIREADETLANDPLIRATAAIAEAYDQA